MNEETTTTIAPNPPARVPFWVPMSLLGAGFVASAALMVIA